MMQAQFVCESAGPACHRSSKLKTSKKLFLVIPHLLETNFTPWPFLLLCDNTPAEKRCASPVRQTSQPPPSYSFRRCSRDHQTSSLCLAHQQRGLSSCFVFFFAMRFRFSTWMLTCLSLLYRVSFFGFAGAASALVFSNLGAAYGTAKAG